ncbi:MAG: hypothetical protein HS111_05080 [Kofleriaceae bacterium]|nr:hypothetical protein [Kofleriaceae bacterium]
MSARGDREPGPTIALSPLAAAARLAGRRGRVLLDSGRDDDGCGAWSFLAADPVATLELRGGRAIELGPGGALRRDGPAAPLAAIDRFARAHGAGLGEGAEVRTSDDPRPRPRVMGFLSYDLGRSVSASAPARPASDDTP